MKWLDLPPVWLVGFIGLVWAIGKVASGWSFHLEWSQAVAFVLAGAGILLMGLAVLEMSRHRTTVIPRQNAARLVTSGVFRFSRNPIYLGDALVLLASIFWWGTFVALPLVWVFARLIFSRFIEGEEAALRLSFGAEFTSWAEKTRRWL